MKKVLVFCSMVLLLSGVFAVFPGETVHVMDFVDCDYLTVVADENCFVFNGCNKVDLFGFEWKCTCDPSTGFSLFALVSSDAPPSSIGVSMLKNVEVVSHSSPINWGSSRRTIKVTEKEDLNDLIVIGEDLNDLIVVVEDLNEEIVDPEPSVVPVPTVMVISKSDDVFFDVNVLPAPLVAIEDGTGDGFNWLYLVLLVSGVLVFAGLFVRKRMIQKKEVETE